MSKDRSRGMPAAASGPSAPMTRGRTEALLPGCCVTLPLTDTPGDSALVRLLAVPQRDLLRNGTLPAPLAPFRDALLVEVTDGSRVLLPGAWVQTEVFTHCEPAPRRRWQLEDLRLPAVLWGDGTEAELHWGETVWPMPLQGGIRIPESCRARPHSTAMLRRLSLVAAGRRGDVGLTLWQQSDFDVPWQDVRLVPHAAWWFEIAQVPPTLCYREAVEYQRGLDSTGS